jgi:hypothetical protein
LKVIKAYGIISELRISHMHYIFFIFMLVSTSFAENSQPQKESTADLRNGMVMFSVEDIAEETTIWLERTQGLDYFLKIKIEDEEKIQKITTKEAKRLDSDFASRFLKCQYEYPTSEPDCKVTLRLSLKGDSQEICKKEDKKTQEIVPFFKDLEKRF